MNTAIRCACCDRFSPHKAHGWCQPCYLRWLRAGQPDDGPPKAVPRDECAARARAAYQEQARGRLEDYQELRNWETRREVTAKRLGITVRTTWRYEKRLRNRRPAPTPRT